MEIIVAENAGFCFGVRSAVEKAYQAAADYNGILCLGELIHNNLVLNDLYNKGMREIDKIEEARSGDTVIIRAHGVSKDVYSYAEENGIILLDYTCPKVKNIHRKIEEYENKGYKVILIGEGSHPEVIGSKGHGNDVSVVNSREDVGHLPGFSKVFLVVQTTYSVSKFKELEELLKKKYENMEVFFSICESTYKRQEEAELLAKKCDAVVVVGSSQSSNTRKLYETALSFNGNVLYVEDERDDTLKDVTAFNKIGILAGASAPGEVIDKVKERLFSLENMAKEEGIT